MPASLRRRWDQVLGGQRWLVLLASVAVAGCASGARIAATIGSPPLRQLLLVGSTSGFYDPCQGTFFVSECGLALGSAGVAINSPTVQEFILQYKSAAAAARAEQSQRTTELSAGWLCSAPSQCPVTPVAVGPVGPPVYAVTFTIGARGNLSETTRLAAVTKGRYLVNLSWISASAVSASRVTLPGVARALLKEALGKIPA